MSKKFNRKLQKGIRSFAHITKGPMLLLWIGMTIIYIFDMKLANENANLGRQLLAIEARSREQVIQNLILENQIASQSGLQYISARAEEMGFKPAEQREWLKFPFWKY